MNKAHIIKSDGGESGWTVTFCGMTGVRGLRSRFEFDTADNRRFEAVPAKDAEGGDCRRCVAAMVAGKVNG